MGVDDRSKATMPDTISMYEHEEEMFRMERTQKRLHIIYMIIIGILVGIIGALFVYFSMFDTISYSQDGQGINNINTGKQGDIIRDGAEISDQSEEGRQSQGSENP